MSEFSKHDSKNFQESDRKQAQVYDKSFFESFEKAAQTASDEEILFNSFICLSILMKEFQRRSDIKRKLNFDNTKEEFKSENGQQDFNFFQFFLNSAQQTPNSKII